MLSFIQVTHVCFGHGDGTTLVTKIMDFSSCIKFIEKILVMIHKSWNNMMHKTWFNNQKKGILE
jgi:hypothetical protein